MGSDLLGLNDMRLQFVLWRDWQGFHFARASQGLALVYDWYAVLGWLEIRKWHNLKHGDDEKEEHNNR